MKLKLGVWILSSEAPLDGASFSVSRLLPCIDFGLQGIAIGHSPIQALAAEDANLNLPHVEPTRMFGYLVKLHAAQEFVGSTRTKHIIEAFSEVGVE